MSLALSFLRKEKMKLSLPAKNKGEFYNQIIEADRLYKSSEMYPLANVPSFNNPANEPMSIDDIHMTLSVDIHKFYVENPQPENIQIRGQFISPLQAWEMKKGDFYTAKLNGLNASENEKNEYRKWVNSRLGNSFAELGTELVKVAGLAAAVYGGVTALAALSAPVAASAALPEGVLAGQTGLLTGEAASTITLAETSSQIAGVTLIDAGTGITLASVPSFLTEAQNIINQVSPKKEQPKNQIVSTVQENKSFLEQNKNIILIGVAAIFGLILI